MKFYVVFYDFDRPIRAAIVYKNIFPVFIGLLKNAFDTFRQIVLTIIKRSQNADEWGAGIHTGMFLTTTLSSLQILHRFCEFASDQFCRSSCDQLYEAQLYGRMRRDTADGGPKGLRYQIRDWRSFWQFVLIHPSDRCQLGQSAH